MATTKKYDVAVKVGEYKDSSGKEKARYLTVGSVVEKDDGGTFMLLDRTFNPAGVPNPDNRGNVILSFFEPKPTGAQTSSQSGGGQQSRAAAPASDDQFADDIPF